MRNSILGCFLALILMQACKKDEVNVQTCENCNFTCLETNEADVITNDCIDNWECNFKVTAQSKVDVEEPLGLVSGDKNVFQIINSTQGDPMIADDEFTNILVFELDESQNSFSVEDSEMNDLKVHFRRICFCSEIEFQELTAGCIQGEKQTDGTWFVQGSMIIPYSFGDITLKFDAHFEN